MVKKCNFFKGNRKPKLFIHPPKKRNEINLNQQTQVLSLVDKGLSFKDIEKQTGVKKNTVSSIKRRREKIENYIGSDENDDMTSRKRLRAVPHPKVEKSVFLWFLQQRNINVPISN